MRLCALIAASTLVFAAIQTCGLAADETAKPQAGWVCEPGTVAGLNYSRTSKTWSTTDFRVGPNYIVRRPKEGDEKVYPNALSQEYVVLMLTGPNNAYVTTCADPPAVTGLMVCQRDHEMIIFAINTRLLRMEAYTGGGYVTQADPGKFAAAVSVEIGRCSPI